MNDGHQFYLGGRARDLFRPKRLSSVLKSEGSCQFQTFSEWCSFFKDEGLSFKR